MEPHSGPVALSTRAACVLSLGAFWAIGYFALGARAQAVPAIDPSIPLDGSIPFVGWAVWPYLLGIIFIGSLAVTIRSPPVFRESAIAYAIVIGFSFMCFFLAPTAAEGMRSQASFAGLDGYTTFAVKMLHAIDPATNQAPSMHVSLACVAACMSARQYPTKQAFFGGLLVIVTASVLVLKQHAIIDVLAGLAVAAIALVLSPCIRVLQWDR
jgi:membrane-associated phospholipid phosphatase